MPMPSEEHCAPHGAKHEPLNREPLCLEPRSEHARRRQQQRAARAPAIDATLRWGRLIRQMRNRSAYFLGRNEVQQAARAGESIARFLGTIVVQATDGTLITVIRSHNCSRLRRMAR